MFSSKPLWIFPRKTSIRPNNRGCMQTCRRLLRSVDTVLAAAQQGAILRDGLRVALSGAPNVGKSSIINALSQDEVAIVTPIAGTTRDLIRQTVEIGGLPVHIVDTAGLRRAQDPIEAIGIARTWETIANADLVLLVSDHLQPDSALQAEFRDRLPPGRKLILVHNKIDLTGHEQRLVSDATSPEVWISAKTGAGLDLLREAIVRAAGWTGADTSLVHGPRAPCSSTGTLPRTA